MEIYGLEAAREKMGAGLQSLTFLEGKMGVLHGTMTYIIRDTPGPALPTHSGSAGLHYAHVEPAHVFLKDSNKPNL